MAIPHRIVEHLAVPHTGILSRTAANRSWGYEVLLSRAYAWFGRLGIGLYGTFLTLAVAYGFLAWYMPDYPVAIDGRTDLYGDEMDKLFFDSQNADTSYTTDP